MTVRDLMWGSRVTKGELLLVESGEWMTCPECLRKVALCYGRSGDAYRVMGAYHLGLRDTNREGGEGGTSDVVQERARNPTSVWLPGGNPQVAE